MNTSTQHPPHLSGTPEEGNLHDTHIPTPQWVSNLVKGIADRVGGFIEVMKNGLENQRKIEEIAIACEQSGNYGFASFGSLIRQNWNINEKNSYGQTALIWAALKGDTEITQLLLTRPEIQVNEKDSHVYTAIIIAAYDGHIEITQLLLADHQRLDLRIDDQWKQALKKAKTPKIKTLIKEAMKKQGISF